MRNRQLMTALLAIFTGKDELFILLHGIGIKWWILRYDDANWI